MSEAHNALVDLAKEAIDDVHADNSVPQATTVESLNDIIGHAEMLRDIVQNEIDAGVGPDALEEDGT